MSTRFNLCKCGSVPLLGEDISPNPRYRVWCDGCGQKYSHYDSSELRNIWNERNPEPAVADPVHLNPEDLNIDEAVKLLDPTPQQSTESILQEAERIINGPRRDAYGPPLESFQAVARGWSEILRKKLKEPITGHESALMMGWFKIVRESNAHERDNLTDGCGYLALGDSVWNAEHPKEPTYAENTTNFNPGSSQG